MASRLSRQASSRLDNRVDVEVRARTIFAGLSQRLAPRRVARQGENRMFYRVGRHCIEEKSGLPHDLRKAA